VTFADHLAGRSSDWQQPLHQNGSAERKQQRHRHGDGSHLKKAREAYIELFLAQGK
jgi:hypothetical protein